MDKPMFPLSVTREFTFRAFLDTGESLDSASFKCVYQRTLEHLRCEIGEVKGDRVTPDNYSSQWAFIEYGYETLYEIRKGYYYSEWNSLKRYCSLMVSNCSIGVHRWDDDKQIWISREGV